MLLIVFILFVKIVFFSCIFGNKNDDNLIDEINRQRKSLSLSNIHIDLTLKLAAEKRCHNQEQLIDSYQNMISNIYKDDDWPKYEQLDKIFSHVNERIYLNGNQIRNDIFQTFLSVPYLYQRNFLYIGIALHEYKNFSAKCILYGELNNSVSNHRRIIRLLYILIGCGILLLGLIVCSIMNDHRLVKIKQQLEQEIVVNRNTSVPKTSTNMFIDKDQRLTLTQRADMNRKTMPRLGSVNDERSSAVHSFFPKS